MSLLRTDKEIEDIYNRNADRIYRTALMLLANKADAEDIVHTVFLKFIDKNIIFKDLEHEKAWFIIVAKNSSKDLLKSFWKSKRVGIEGTSEQIYVESVNEENELLSEIKKMKSNYRISLYLYYYEGFSIKEIAGIMNRNESTIQTWLSSGRKKLKVELGGNQL